MNLKTLAIALTLSTPAWAQTHLATLAIHMQDGQNLRMKPMEVYTEIHDIKPKSDKNMAWTSIKTCLSTHMYQNMTLSAELFNTDTGETYYWHKHEGNGCNKETFDIPVHTFHNLKLRLICMAYPLSPAQSDIAWNGNRERLQYCRAWTILSTQTSD